MDLVEDAIKCLGTLEQLVNCKKNEIFILGHSEGTIIAAQMSVRQPSIAGIILLCPFVQDMETILYNQAKHIQQAINNLKGIKGVIYRLISKLMGNQVASQKKLIKKLKSSSAPTIRYWFRKIPANWLRELLKIDPHGIFKQVTRPTLLIGGEKDIQCDPDDVGHIAKLTEGTVEAHIIKDLTHILRVDKQQSSIFRYTALIKKPVAPVIPNLAIHWLKKMGSENNCC